MAVDINSKIGQAIRKLVPLATLSKFHFSELCREINIDNEHEGFVLFNKGDDHQDLFYLLSGEVSLQAEGYNFETIAANTDAARFAVAHQIPRQVDAIANTDISFIHVTNSQINNPPKEDKEENSYMVSDEPEENSDDWMTTLLKSPVFQRLPASNLQQILISLDEVDFHQGESIIKQGEISEYYYLIRKGQCRMTRKPTPAAKEIQLGYLQDRDTFGEDSLLMDEPNSLTISALADISLLRLDKEKFITLISKPSLQFLDYATIQQELKDGAMLLDVRLPDAYKDNHLEGSKNIPFFSLGMQIKSFDRKRKVIVVCADGRLSSAAVFLLIKNKINAYILAGGMEQVPLNTDDLCGTIAIDEDIDSILTSPAVASMAPKDTPDSSAEVVSRETDSNQISKLQAKIKFLNETNHKLTQQCSRLSKEKVQAEQQLQILSVTCNKLRDELSTLQGKV